LNDERGKLRAGQVVREDEQADSLSQDDLYFEMLS
jgi:hypothetical protein